MSRGAIAAPGYPFILTCTALIILGLIQGWYWLAAVSSVGGAFFTYFFRDPERSIPGKPEAIVSPADGRVISIDEVVPEKYLPVPAKRLAIFMNVFDVHVNRVPLAGTVTGLFYRRGGFQAAFRSEAHRHNEQHAMVVEAEDGRRALVVQIAGVLARRIINYVRAGDRLTKGERFGMICFGSRVDLYLPPTCEITVQVGDRLKAGSSIVGRWI